MSRITRATDIKGRSRRQRAGHDLNDIQDLDASSPIDGDVVMYDGTEWKSLPRGEIRICMLALAVPFAFS